MARKVFGGICLAIAIIGVLAAVTKSGESIVSSVVITVVFLLVGVVLLFKRKKGEREAEKQNAKPLDAYVSTKNVTYRTDGAVISNSEIPYLMESELQSAKDYAVASENPKFKRTNRERELMTQFFVRYGAISQKKTDAFENLDRQAYRTEDLDEKIEYLQAALQKYQEAKDWHYNKSKGAALWFQDVWECMHNSKNSCFAWDESVREYLDDLIYERDVVMPYILKAASDGILQKDLYHFFPEESRKIVQACVKRLEKTGIILKNKKGNTYHITIR